MDDPFLTLLIEALNVMHPRFAAANPVHEFHHQFRRLWDKALPVQLGLGHILLQPDPTPPPGPAPDFLFWQLEPERRFAAVNFNAIEPLLSHTAYPYRVVIGYGIEPPAADGIARIKYDTQRRTASLF
jgi:hypothetical protein